MHHFVPPFLHDYKMRSQNFYTICFTDIIEMCYKNYEITEALTKVIEIAYETSQISTSKSHTTNSSSNDSTKVNNTSKVNDSSKVMTVKLTILRECTIYQVLYVVTRL